MDYLDRLKLLIVAPNSFFRKAKKDNDYKDAFTWFAIFSAIGAVLSWISLKLFLNPMFANIPGFGNSTGLVMAIGGYVVGLALVFVLVAILHLWLLIFGARQGYQKSFQAVVYSITPGQLLSWIPFVGVFAVIWQTYLIIIATQELHRLPRTRSILMWAIPAAILILFSLGSLIVAPTLMGGSLYNF